MICETLKQLGLKTSEESYHNLDQGLSVIKESTHHSLNAKIIFQRFKQSIKHMIRLSKA